MCGRYIQVKNIEIIEKRFNVHAQPGFELTPNFNVSAGDFAPVITTQNPRTIELMQFGLTPFWAKKPMYLINARAEGDKNADNNINYSGGKDIINKPAFRKPLRSQRCLVIADAFYEGTTQQKLDCPFLVYLKNKQAPFAFAGIYDTWLNPTTNQLLNSFAIITTVANSLLQMLPHHRSPVILPRHYEQKWLNPATPLSDITKILVPYQSGLMNAYKVSAMVKDPKIKTKELITPLSQPLVPETTITATDTLRLLGMGHYKRPGN